MAPDLLGSVAFTIADRLESSKPRAVSTKLMNALVAASGVNSFLEHARGRFLRHAPVLCLAAQLGHDQVSAQTRAVRAFGSCFSLRGEPI